MRRGRRRGGATFIAGAWGSFEAWSRLIIPPAIVYAGGLNVLEARPTARGESSDVEADAHVTLMRA